MFCIIPVLKPKENKSLILRDNCLRWYEFFIWGKKKAIFHVFFLLLPSVAEVGQ